MKDARFAWPSLHWETQCETFEGQDVVAHHGNHSGAKGGSEDFFSQQLLEKVLRNGPPCRAKNEIAVNTRRPRRQPRTTKTSSLIHTSCPMDQRTFDQTCKANKHLKLTVVSSVATQSPGRTPNRSSTSGQGRGTHQDSRRS